MNTIPTPGYVARESSVPAAADNPFSSLDTFLMACLYAFVIYTILEHRKMNPQNFSFLQCIMYGSVLSGVLYVFSSSVVLPLLYLIFKPFIHFGYFLLLFLWTVLKLFIGACLLIGAIAVIQLVFPNNPVLNGNDFTLTADYQLGNRRGSYRIIS